jgi:glycosyltransferase involved in cell wall biosynthesis
MGQYGSSFCRAVAATDAVVSVSKCTAYQFAEVYGYNGPVKVVPYHNRLFFSDVLPFPPGPPWKIGFLGRLELDQKNLDTLIRAFGRLATERADIQLHLYGGGPDQAVLQELAKKCGVASNVSFHGVYDHRIDLPQILGGCHFFVHPSRYEGGPCFSLLEVMQAGRWCVVSAVGGIPDLYAGHPECGHLVPQCDDGTLLLDALRRGLDLAAAGALDPLAIRRRYHNGFDMASAHKAWLAALSLPVLMDIK